MSFGIAAGSELAAGCGLRGAVCALADTGGASLWVDSAEQPDRRISRAAGSKACFSRGLRLKVVGVWLGVILVVAVKEVVNPVVCFG